MRGRRAESLAARLVALGLDPAHARRLVAEWLDHAASLRADLGAQGLSRAAARAAARQRLGGLRLLLEAARAGLRRRGWWARHPALLTALTPALGLSTLLALGLASIGLLLLARLLGAPPAGAAAQAWTAALLRVTGEAPWPLLAWLLAAWAARHGLPRRHVVLGTALLGLTGAATWVGCELPLGDAPGSVGVALGLLPSPWRLLSAAAGAWAATLRSAGRARATP